MKVYAVKGHRLLETLEELQRSNSVVSHHFAKMKGEVWFRNHADAERYAEDLVVFAHAEVEMQHLNVGENPLAWCGALPKFESKISRLDIYSVKDGCLNRRTCNIF